MKRIQCIKMIAFTMICSIMLVFVSQVVGKADSSWGYQFVPGFYAERANSLDAVYIGGSNVFMFWEAPLAWAHYGITVWPFASDAQNLCAAEHLIREARKTQPNALYIIGISSLDSGMEMQWIHELTDFLPMNSNRNHIIERWTDLAGIDSSERLEYYFPLLRFHSRWASVRAKDFKFISNGQKSGTLNYRVEDISGKYYCTDEKQPLDTKHSDVLKSLLEYCDAENVNVLFVTTPQARNFDSLERLNYACDMVMDYGYSVLDMQKLAEEIELDFTTDFYNTGHVNVHGAVKTTDYLARYLTDNYGFQDKRSNPDYSDWNLGYKKYIETIAPHTLPFEYEDTEWNYELNAPVMFFENSGKNLCWESVDGADGYGIFGKEGTDAWRLLATVDAETLSWEGINGTASDETRYVVAAYSEDADGIYWGNYDIVSTMR